MPATQEFRSDASAETPTVRQATAPRGPLLGPGGAFPVDPDQDPEQAAGDEGERPTLSSRQRGMLIAAAAVVAAVAITIPFLISGGSPAHAQTVAATPPTHAPLAPTPPPSEQASLAPGVFGSATTSAAPHSPSPHPSSARPTQPTQPTHPKPTRSTVSLPSPLGSWPLDGGWGTNDSTGAFDAVANGVSLTPNDGAVFNGSSSSITVSGPVLNTAAGGSFTVAAWVYLTNTGNFATAVSQDGTTNSGFYLQYSAPNKRWAFSRVAQDTAGSPGIRALSSAPPLTDRWTHLVGVYNAVTEELSLYVNGALQGTAKDTTPFAASGDLAIGRALFNSKPADWFPGQIKDVEAFNQALTSAQAAAL